MEKRSCPSCRVFLCLVCFFCFLFALKQLEIPTELIALSNKTFVAQKDQSIISTTQKSISPTKAAQSESEVPKTLIPDKSLVNKTDSVASIEIETSTETEKTNHSNMGTIDVLTNQYNASKEYNSSNMNQSINNQSSSALSMFNESAAIQINSDDFDHIEMQKVYDYQRLPRQALVKQDDMKLIIYAAVPNIMCPYLVRIGGVGDGGKWMCNPWRAPENCVIYSFGVGDENTWETDMLNLLPTCQTYSFDPNPDFARLFERNKRMHFWAQSITGTADIPRKNMTTFDSIRKLHNHSKVDFLKIDVEGPEYAIFPEIFRNKTKPVIPICHIFVETHGTTGKVFRTLLKSFERAGYLMYAREVIFCGTPCSEYSYIHETCLQEYGLNNITKWHLNFEPDKTV